MAFLSQTSNTITCRTIITEKGREYLLSQDSSQKRKFNLVKFTFGDSEIDYSLPPEQIAGNTAIITSPSEKQDTLSSPMFYSGQKQKDLEVDVVADKNIFSRNQTIHLYAITINSRTREAYDEQYTWTNMGPLFDLLLEPSEDTKSAKLTVNATNGIAKIKVAGKSSGQNESIHLSDDKGTIHVYIPTTGDVQPPPPPNPDPPAGPMWITPTSGSIYSAQTAITYQWSAVTGGVFYQVQISRNSGFTGTHVVDSFGVTTTYTPSTGMLNNVYYLRVRAFDSLSQVGAWSGNSYTHRVPPNTPQLLSLSDGASSDGLPTFDWTDCQNASTYDLQLDTVTSFTNFVEYTGISVSNYSISSALAEGDTSPYYWRVRGRNSVNMSGNFSQYWSFYVPIKLPEAAVLLTPETASAFTTNVTFFGEDTSVYFSWSASRYTDSYTLQVATATSFASKIIDVELFDTYAYTGTGFTVGTYYWRIVSNKFDLLHGTTSGQKSFVIQEAVPQAPTLLTPPSGSVQEEEEIIPEE